MSTKLDRHDFASVGLMGAAATGTVALFASLPDPMAIHFDAHGHANGFAPRAFGAPLMPVLSVAIWLILRFLPSPRLDGTQPSSDASTRALVALVPIAFFTGMQGLVLHAALQSPPHLGDGVWALLGAVFVGLGLIFPRVRRNRWIGFRTPWALASDENWARTHRVAGYSMVLGGGASVVLAMAGAPLVGVGILLVSSLAPMVYSYLLAKEA